MDSHRWRWMGVVLALTVAGCHHREVATAADATQATTAATPSPAPLASPPPGDGDFASFLREYESGLEFDQATKPDELALSVNAVAWLAHGDDETWQKIVARVGAVARNSAQTLGIAVQNPNPARAQIYHEAAEKPENAARAEELYRRAALLNPKSADYINHLSIEASKRKDFTRGERYALLAMAVDHNFIGAYQELAYALKNLHRYEECIAVAERGLDLPDGDLHSKSLLLARQGQAWWMLSKEDEARRAFMGSVKLGGPAWVQTYLDGKQVLGKEYVEPAP